MFITINLTAGQRVEFREVYDFVRIMDSTAAVNLEFFRKEREVDEAVGVVSGFSETFEAPCDRLVIVNGATAQAVTFATRQGSRVEYDRPPTGNVAVTDVTQCPDVSELTAVVGTASMVLAGWSPRRRSMMIQNQSDSATVWLSFNNAGVSVGTGFRLRPGETFYNDLVSCPKVVNAIADQAGATVRWVEFQR